MSAFENCAQEKTLIIGHLVEEAEGRPSSQADKTYTITCS